jgi:Nucleotidyl transferase AbiEii toxin, Type IV TA system
LLAQPFDVLAYPMAAVLGEKVETMVRRGDANTRERYFADVWSLSGTQSVDASEFGAAVRATAAFRGTQLVPLSEALRSYAQLRQRAWGDFLARAGLGDAVPGQLDEVVRDVARFADPVLSGEVTDGTWGPAARSWVVT